MAHGLSPVTLDGGGLEPALKALVRRARETYRISVRLRLKVSADLTMNDATASHLYRITQEAINNAVRHAQARQILINLKFEARLVQLSVRDDGQGFDYQSPQNGDGKHFGLVGMRERAEQISGTLKINSRKNEGTEVVVDVPIGG